MDYSTPVGREVNPLRKQAGAREEVEEIRGRLQAMSDPRAATPAKAALGSPLFKTARALWKSRWHEERSTAIHMVAALAAYRKMERVRGVREAGERGGEEREREETRG